MVLAGFALTITTLPKTSRFPAFVAGFTRVFSMHSPGSVILPVFLTSLVTTSAKLVITFTQSLFFSSVFAATASARPVLLRLFTAFIAFIDFMGAIVVERRRCGREKYSLG